MPFSCWSFDRNSVFCCAWHQNLIDKRQKVTRLQCDTQCLWLAVYTHPTYKPTYECSDGIKYGRMQHFCQVFFKGGGVLVSNSTICAKESDGNPRFESSVPLRR